MRCFVAIELPDTIRQNLADLQARLRALDRSVRWTRPEHLHLTLKFLGEVPDAQVIDICSCVTDAVADATAIRLHIRGTGCFPPYGAVRILWAGIDGPPAELIACHQACETALELLGYPREQRAFNPHLTIGRARNPRGARDVRGPIEQVREFDAGTFLAVQLVVFQSVLGRSGPAYTPLARVPLRTG